LADGRPRQWPTPPLDETDDESFIRGEWDWFQKPKSHRRTVALDDRLAAFWAMDGETGDIEPDLVGQNDLSIVGGRPGEGQTDEFHYRRFDGEDDYLQVDPTSALEDPRRFWLAFPLRPRSLSEKNRRLLSGIQPNGYSITVAEEEELRFVLKNRSLNSKTAATIPATSNQFQTIQLWSDPEQAQIGFRVGTNEVVRDGAYGSSVKTGYNPFVVGSRPNGGFNFAGDVGPVMIANAVPRKADRRWVDNDGAFRSLPEIRNHEVTILDV
jgi:hypothetical protein